MEYTTLGRTGPQVCRICPAPIVGATKLAHLEKAIAVVDVALDDEELRRLEEPYLPQPVLGHG